MDRSDIPVSPPSPTPVEDDEEEERKRARGGDGASRPPLHAQLGANIRPDVVSGPAGLETVTTQKSQDYRPDLEAAAAQAEQKRQDDALDEWLVQLGNEPLPAQEPIADRNTAGAAPPDQDLSRPLVHPYAEEIAAGIREAQASGPNDHHSKSNELYASLHYDLARDLAALPPVRPAALYPFDKEPGRVVTAPEIALELEGVRTAHPEGWGSTPLDAALRREAATDGHDPKPVLLSGETGLQRPADILDIYMNPWNAVVMPLAPDATAATREVALQAAAYCALGEHQLMHLTRSGEHVPTFYQPGRPDEIDAHEYAESNWQRAEGAVCEMLLFKYRDTHTLSRAEEIVSPDNSPVLAELDDVSREVLTLRDDLTQEHFYHLQDRESGLALLERQAQESTRRQDAERRANAGEELAPHADIARYIDGLAREAHKETEIASERDVEAAQERGPESSGRDQTRGSGGRGFF